MFIVNYLSDFEKQVKEILNSRLNPTCQYLSLKKSEFAPNRAWRKIHIDKIQGIMKTRIVKSSLQTRNISTAVVLSTVDSVREFSANAKYRYGERRHAHPLRRETKQDARIYATQYVSNGTSVSRRAGVARRYLQWNTDKVRLDNTYSENTYHAKNSMRESLTKQWNMGSFITTEGVGKGLGMLLLLFIYATCVHKQNI